MRCEEVFREIYNRDPDGVAFCPYRISPLGAHIDHQYGKINGLALDKGIHIAFSPKRNGVVELKSLNFPKRAQFHVNGIPEQKVGIGVRRGMVVYGTDKLDEISMSAPTKICEIKDGWFKSYKIRPEDFGFERCTKDDLKGGTPAENAQITRDILSGKQGHKRNATLLNAGAALYIGGKADSIKDGIKLAAELIDSGEALKTLEKLIDVSNRTEGKR